MKTSEWNTLLKEQHERAFAVAQAFTPAQAEEIVRNGQNAAEEFRRKSQFWADSQPPAGCACKPSPEEFGTQSIPARKDTYAIQKPVDFGKAETTEQQFQLKVRVVERRVGADLHFEYAAPGHKSARYSVQHVPGVRVGDRVCVCVNDTLGQTVFIKTAPGVFAKCVPTVVNQYGFFVDAPIRRNDPMAEPIKEGEQIILKEVMDVLRRYGITVGTFSAVSGT